MSDGIELLKKVAGHSYADLEALLQLEGNSSIEYR